MASIWGPRRERGEQGGFSGHQAHLDAAVAAQDAVVSTVRATVAKGYGSASLADLAVCFVNPVGVYYATGEPAVRADYAAALERAEAAIRASAIEAQVFDGGRVRLSGAGGLALLDEYPIDGDTATERRLGEAA